MKGGAHTDPCKSRRRRRRRKRRRRGRVRRRRRRRRRRRMRRRSSRRRFNFGRLLVLNNPPASELKMGSRYCHVDWHSSQLSNMSCSDGQVK
jgi:hypothetical protein